MPLISRYALFRAAMPPAPLPPELPLIFSATTKLSYAIISSHAAYAVVFAFQRLRCQHAALAAAAAADTLSQLSALPLPL